MWLGVASLPCSVNLPEISNARGGSRSENCIYLEKDIPTLSWWVADENRFVPIESGDLAGVLLGGRENVG